MSDLMYFRTIGHLVNLFVLPEIEKRLKDGRITPKELPFVVLRFRASQKRLPDETIEPIVELNDEVQLLIETRIKRDIAAGEWITLEDIYPEECRIVPPEYDGKPAAYFYVQYVAFSYNLAFDCQPNHPGITEEQLRQAKIPFPVLDIENARQFNETVKPDEKLELFAKNNWPPAPGYYPHALSFIHNEPSKIADISFVKAVSESYDAGFWSKRLEFWESTNFFPNRLQYIKTAIDHHFEKQYASSTYVLVPQFEGIVKDYLTACGRSCPPGFVDCIRAFRDLVFSRRVLIAPTKLIQIMFEFLENGSFWKQTRTIANPSESINRHGIVHGVFTGFESEAISLKYLILLDALSFLLLHDRMLAGTL